MRSVYDNLTVAGIVAQFNTLGAITGVQSAPSGTSIDTYGAAVDTKGYNSAAIRVFTSTIKTGLAAGAGGSLGVVLQESADATTWSTANDNSGTAIGVTQTATTTAVIGSARVEGLGTTRLRYLRLKVTAYFANALATSNTYGFTSAAVIELGRSYQRPVTTTTSNT